MANSEAIRKHLVEHYVAPARQRGDLTVTIQVSAATRELGDETAIAAVSAVLGSEKFEQEARVRRLAVDGPIPGGRTLFVYRL